MADYRYNLDIDVRSQGIKETRQQIEQLKKDLAEAKKQGRTKDFLKDDLNGVFKDAKSLKDVIKQVENSLDKLAQKGNSLTIRDLAEFNNDLRKAGVNVNNLDRYLESMGKQGVKSIGKLSNATYDLGIQVDKIDDKFSKLGNQIQHEIVDNIVMAGFNAMGSAIDRAIYFTKDLNRTLTDIQVVSGKSAEDMAEFARQSNEAAKALGSTTDEFANSALIFYQQGGYTEQEVRKLAEATTVAANITRQSTDIVADQLTALINAFGVQTEDVMSDVVDVFANIGAVSGSNFEELATATQKFASQAKTAGYEGAEGIQEMGAQIATVVETTRQSADSIGIGFKTILSRIQGIKDAGGEMDSKLVKSLTHLNRELAEIGAKQFEIFDEYGDLRGADELIKDLGDTWMLYGDQLSEATKKYVMQEVAGVEQASRLAALFDNWDRYLEILDEAQNSQGVALQQQLIFMDSIDAKAAGLRTEFESMIMSLNVEGIVKTFYDGMINIAKSIGDVISQTSEWGESLAKVFGMSEELGSTLGAWVPLIGVATAAFNKFAAGAVAARIAVGSSQKSYISALTQDIKDAEGSAKQIKQIQLDIARSSGYEKAQQYEKIQQKIIDNGRKELALWEKVEQITGESKDELKKRNAELNEANAKLGEYRDKLTLIRDVKNNVTDQTKTLEEITSKLPDHIKEQIRLQDILNNGVTTRADKEKEIAEALKTQESHAEGTITRQQDKIDSLESGTLDEETRERIANAEAIEAENTALQNRAKNIENESKALSKTKAVIGAVAAASLGLTQIGAGALELLEEGSNKSLGFAKILTGVGTTILTLLSTITTAMASSSVAWVAALAPFMPWIAGAFVAIGGLITLLGGFKSEAEKVAEANAEITKTFTEQKSRIDAVKSSIDGVKESYETLAETGANAQEILASGDQELIDKYLEYANTVADVAPELVQGYDDQGRAIIDLAGSYDKLTESIREQEQSNYAMMASNVDGFATELATNYKMASNEIDAAVQKQKNLQSQLKSAMKSGDTNKIKDINADLLAVNTTIAEQKQILSDTSALVNANLVQPFFKSNETIIKWNETFKGKTIETQNGLVSLNSSINGVVLNTQRLYDLVQAGDAEGISQLFVNAERSMEAFGTSIEAAGDDADALLQKFFEMPMYMQQTGMALQGVFGDQINVLNDFSEQLDAIVSGTQSATEAFDINAESLAKIRVRDLEAQIDELNDEYEGLTAIMRSGASLTMEQSERYGELTEMLEDAKDEFENYTEAIEEGTEAQLINKEAMEEILEVLEDTPEGYNKILDSMNEMFDESGNLMEEHVDSYRQMYTELIDEDAQWYDTQIASNAEVSKWLQDELGIRAGKFTTYQELLTEAERLGVADRLTLMTTEQQEATRLKIESDNAKRTSDALTAIDQINNAIAVGQNTTSVYSAMREAGYSMWQSIMLQGASCADNLVNIWNGFLNAIDGIVYNIKVMFADMWNDIIAGWNSLPSFITDLFGGKAETVSVKKPTKRTTNYKGNTTALLNKYEQQQNKKDIANKINPIDMPNLKPQGIPNKTSGNKPNKVKPNTSANSSGGKDKDKGKGNKGKGNKKEDKDVKDAELDLDPLYEYERALELLGNEMDILKAKEKDLFGKDLIANLQEQNTLLNKKLQILKSESTVIDKQMASQQKLLGTKGFKFDENGMISNYNEMIEKLTNEANSKTGEAKEQAIADLEQIKKTVKDYDKLLTDTSAKLKEDMIKVQQEIQENYQQQIEIVVDVQLDLSEAYEKMYDFQQKFNEGFDKSSESLENMEEYAQSLMGDLKTMEDAISKISKDTNLTQKQKNELLEKLIDEYMDAAENLDEVIKEMGEKITEGLEEGLELIEETAEGYEKIKDYAEEYADILREIYGPAAKDEIIALYDIQLEASQGMLDALKEQQKLAQSYVDALEPGTEEWKAAKKELDEINAEIGSTTLGLLDLMREKMEAFFELSREALEKDIFGGSLDDVEDAWDRINNQQDKYVTTAEKVNKIGKLQAQIQEEIAKTDDPRKKAQLQKFIDTELKALKEKDKLTEKEVERAEKLYILTLKQQALENQQMTAMMARLVRDEAGNWSYEYVQDIGKVNEAQKELSDALEDLMNSDKENLKENQEEMLDLYKQYFDDLEKLQDKAMAGEFASPEDFNAAVDALNKGFTNQLEQLNKEQESLLQNMTQSSMAYLFDMYKQNGGQLGIFSEQTEGIIGGLVGALQSGNISWTDIIKGNYDLISQQLGITKEEAESAIEEMTNAITEDFNTSNEAIKKDYDDLKKKVEEATTDMKKAFEDYFKGVSDTMNTQKDAINNLNTALGQQKEQINKVTEAVNKEADEIKNNLIPSYNALKNKYNQEVNPEVQKFVQGLKDSITELKNNNTAITGSKGLNEALGKLQAEYAKSKNSANSLIGDSTSGLKGVEKKALDAYNKITTLTGSVTSRSISNTKSAISGVDSAIGGVNSSLAGMSSKASTAVSGVISQLNRIPSKKETTITLYTRDKVKSKKRTGQGNDHTEFISYNGFKKYGSYNALEVGQYAYFKSGGYTGDWSKSEGLKFDSDGGKLAVLHQKEMVLNQQDTKNLLDAVKINRDLFSNLLATPKSIPQNISNFDGGDTIYQIDNIELPNVNDVTKFLEELKNLPNRAIQYKYSKKTY